MQTNIETGILTAQLFFAILGFIGIIIALPTIIHSSQAGSKSL